MKFERITVGPATCTGKPCIRGLRFPVARLLGLLAAGETRDAILEAYPYLESADVDEALRYAAFLAEDDTIALSPSVDALPHENIENSIIVVDHRSIRRRRLPLK
ncbi:MAG: DUF433 domain-containing protein [Hyphomicrobiales bacterium]|nr:MAG: DUF433 domain-containing protein [Hyphomicrobiales bacterium]